MDEGPSREVRDAVRRVRLGLRGRVREGLTGLYRSAFRGSGLEFREVREYVPGDEARFVDWNVSARRGRLHVKTFDDERERDLFAVMDLSASIDGLAGVGSARRLWLDTLALLGLAAVEAGDRVGLASVGAEEDFWFEPAAGGPTFLRRLQRVSQASPGVASHGLRERLELCSRDRRRRGILIVASDFLEEDWLAGLGELGWRHEVVAVRAAPDLSFLEDVRSIVALRDPETGVQHEVDLGDADVRRTLREDEAAASAAWRRACASAGVESLELSAGASAVDGWLAFLMRRARSGS